MTMTLTQDAAALADELAAIAGRCSIEADRYTIIKAVGALRAPIQPVEAEKTLHGQIAAVYGKLDAEDCALVDREWATMRGYILPTNGTSVLASPPSQPALREAAQAVVDDYPYAAGSLNMSDESYDGYGSIRALRLVLATAPTPAKENKMMHVTDAQIEHMVNRFLGWRLPKDFNPDAGISYTRPNYAPSVDATPTGTNLFDATQADAMVRYMVEGLSVPAEDARADGALEHIAEIANYGAKKLGEVDPACISPKIAQLTNAAIERFCLIARTAKNALANNRGGKS